MEGGGVSFPHPSGGFQIPPWYVFRTPWSNRTPGFPRYGSPTTFRTSLSVAKQPINQNGATRLDKEVSTGGGGHPKRGGEISGSGIQGYKVVF